MHFIDNGQIGGPTYFGEPNVVLGAWKNKLEYSANKTQDTTNWLLYLNNNENWWFPHSIYDLNFKPFLEFLLIPARMIVEPIIRTIIAIKTRKPFAQNALQEIETRLKELLENNPDGFDALIECITNVPLRNNTARKGNSIFLNIQLYQSLNSKALIMDLYLAKFKEDHYLSMTRCKNEKEERLKAREINRRQEQFQAICNYLNTSENNGTKLMQYMDSILSNEFTNQNQNGSTKKIKRLLELQNFAKVQLDLAIDLPNLNMDFLREALATKNHYDQFFKHMPQSYNIVFGTDNSSNQSTQIAAEVCVSTNRARIVYQFL